MGSTNLSKPVVPDHYEFIDGLRAIAVILVILFHFKLLGLAGGFLGVDVFFVISGFVITEMVRRSRENGKYSLAQFWRRRVLRIIPALYVTILLTGIVSYFIYLPEDFFRNVVAAKQSLFFYANIHYFFLTDYFSDDNKYWLFLHHWSLSVEEQFYLLFPFYLALVYHFERFRLYLVTFTVFATLLVYFWYYQDDSMRAFFLLPARAWEFLVGSALAFIPKRQVLSCTQASLISSVGLAIIALASFGTFPLVHFAQPDLISVVAGTAMVMLGCLFGTENYVRAFLSLRPLRFVGQISFSLYLVHWPVYVFAQYIAIEPLSLVTRAALLVPTSAIAFASWRLVEMPFRGDHVGQTLVGLKLWLALAVSTSMLFELSNLILANKAQMFRPLPVVENALQGRLDFNKRRSTCHSDEETQPLAPANACSFGSNAKPTVAVWSDSHGAEIAEALGTEIGKQGKSILQLSSSSCPPVLDHNFANLSKCRSRNNAVLSFLQKQVGIKTVVLAMRYDGYPDLSDLSLLTGLQTTSDALVLAGKKVIIIGPIPRPIYDVPHGRARAIYFHREVSNDIFLTTHIASNAKTMAALHRIGESRTASIFDPTQTMCSANRCPMWVNGRPLYFDDNHPSIFGASKIVKGLVPLL